MANQKDKFRVLGVMSGTSLDGVDLVLVDFVNKTWKFKILKCCTINYSNKWVRILNDLYNKEKDKIIEIDKSYTNYLSRIISRFIIENKINNIDLVCSHGHTAIHKPEDGLTYQIGNLNHINDSYNLMTICDFRKQDLFLGGQGAPLVPVGDAILFSDYSACLNLGGFANISKDFNSKRIAFDICAVNIVLNYLSYKKGLTFDKDGVLARSGQINQSLLDKLTKLDYYSLGHPKSLGKEWVVSNIFPIIDQALVKYKFENVIHTYTYHTAIMISKSLEDTDDVLVTGGGALNKFLIETIKKLTKAKLILPSIEIIEFKEALIFGFLGVLKYLDIDNCWSSVTGAYKNHSSGTIYFAKS